VLAALACPRLNDAIEDLAVLPARLQRLETRILGELRRPIGLGGAAIFVSGSIGVAVADAPGATAEDLLIQADAAMYAAKRSGKGRFAVYDSRMPVRAWTELEAAG